MELQFKTVALVGKYQSPEVAQALRLLVDFLRARGCSVWMERGTAEDASMLTEVESADYEVLRNRADLAVVVGGDGTLLAAARGLAGCAVPLVGVNRGRLGFLTDIGRDEMLPQLEQILAGRYRREARMLFDAEVWREGRPALRTVAFNDVVINRGDLGRLIEFELHVDGEYVYTQRSDGMIVSTPTGSTAYALSANGPILHPALAGLTLVPLCPHALTYRPVVLPQDARVELVLLPPHDARVHFDGQTRFDARAGDRVSVQRSPNAVTLLHPADYSPFAVLRQKLHWSAAPRLE